LDFKFLYLRLRHVDFTPQNAQKGSSDLAHEHLVDPATEQNILSGAFGEYLAAALHEAKLQKEVDSKQCGFACTRQTEHAQKQGGDQVEVGEITTLIWTTGITQ
jgi:hypothetical protein